MEGITYHYPVLIGVFLLFQIILGWWSFQRTDSVAVGLAVTYIAVILGTIWLLWVLPEDETPWIVIFTMEFFAGLSVINIINLSVEVGRGNGTQL